MDWQRLLLFSPEAHQSLIAIYNRDWWVVATLAGLAGTVALGWLLTGRALHLRASFALLSANWLWIGIMFHARYLASINWVAYLPAVLCLAMALALLRHAARRSTIGGIGLTSTRTSWLGMGWLLVAVAWGPVTVLLAGGEFVHGRYFGMAPEVVAWATLAMMLLSNTRRWGWFLLLTPIALVESLTAWLLSDFIAVTMWSLFAVTLVAQMWCAQDHVARGRA
jgi:hypothetical protein